MELSMKFVMQIHEVLLGEDGLPDLIPVLFPKDGSVKVVKLCLA